LNENENTTYKNAANAASRQKIIASNASVRKRRGLAQWLKWWNICLASVRP
jgi:hypothetical protein